MKLALRFATLTRTKNRVYLLVNKDPRHRSEFINEIYEIMTENNDQRPNNPLA